MPCSVGDLLTSLQENDARPESQVSLNGYISFTPDIQNWPSANHAYLVVFIQVGMIRGAELTGTARLAALEPPTVRRSSDICRAGLVDVPQVAYEGGRRWAARLCRAVGHHARCRERPPSRSTLPVLVKHVCAVERRPV